MYATGEMEKRRGKKESSLGERETGKETERSLGSAVEGAKEDKEKGGGGPPY